MEERMEERMNKVIPLLITLLLAGTAGSQVTEYVEETVRIGVRVEVENFKVIHFREGKMGASFDLSVRNEEFNSADMYFRFRLIQSSLLAEDTTQAIRVNAREAVEKCAIKPCPQTQWLYFDKGDYKTGDVAYLYIDASPNYDFVPIVDANIVNTTGTYTFCTADEDCTMLGGRCGEKNLCSRPTTASEEMLGVGLIDTVLWLFTLAGLGYASIILVLIVATAWVLLSE